MRQALTAKGIRGWDAQDFKEANEKFKEQLKKSAAEGDEAGKEEDAEESGAKKHGAKKDKGKKRDSRDGPGFKK